MNVKVKLKRGDKVKVIAGKDKGKEGKILVVDRKKGRIIVEGVNMVKKHQKANAKNQQGGIVEKEAAIHASNVMYLHKGKPVKIGYKLEEKEENGKRVVKKLRIARPSGDLID